MNIKMNRVLFMGIFVALIITANAQDNIPKDSLTMEWKSMFRNLPEVSSRLFPCKPQSKHTP